MKTKKYLLIFFITLVLPLTSYADEKDLYDFLWLDPDKAVYVLQNKVYKKAHTFYMNAGFMLGQTSAFQDITGVQGNMGYFLNEEWAIELMYNKYNNSDNDTYKTVQLVNGSEPFVRRVKSSYGALVVWAPFYGKINTFNKIFYFDWSFGVGATKIDAASTAKTVAINSIPTVYASESYTGAILKTSFRFHVTRHFHLDAQYLRQIYKASGPVVGGITPTSKLRHNSDLVFSIGFSF